MNLLNFCQSFVVGFVSFRHIFPLRYGANVFGENHSQKRNQKRQQQQNAADSWASVNDSNREKLAQFFLILYLLSNENVSITLCVTFHLQRLLFATNIELVNGIAIKWWKIFWIFHRISQHGVCRWTIIYFQNIKHSFFIARFFTLLRFAHFIWISKRLLRFKVQQRSI